MFAITVKPTVLPEPPSRPDRTAADVLTDKGDQCVRRPADERYVDGAADADDRLGQTAGKGRDLTGPRIDARDPAGGAFGDVERATGADGAARATLEAGQQQGGSGRRGARCGGRDHRDHGRYQDEQLARLRRRRPRLGPDTATTLAQARVVSVSQG